MESSGLYKSFDARDWAKEFNEVVRNNYRVNLDEEWLITWFSSALMRGYDEKTWQMQKKNPFDPANSEYL